MVVSLKGGITMIPQRVVKDGANILFDARKDALTKQKDKVLIKMLDGRGSIMTPEGVTFWVNHPYRWVSEKEAQFLLGSREPSFALATLDQVEDHYAY
jgi:hypothetical protein